MTNFIISKIEGGEKLNQGHYNTMVTGEFSTEKIRFHGGSYLVKTGQKLGSLAAYLLEPQTDDGLLSWNFFDKYLAPQWGTSYLLCPVYKLMTKMELPSVETGWGNN